MLTTTDLITIVADGASGALAAGWHSMDMFIGIRGGAMHELLCN